MPETFSKWVACWGNATSITDRKEATYAKDLTLRYPIRACFSGNKLRFHFSNLTGTEPVTISEAYVAHSPVTSAQSSQHPAGSRERFSDASSDAVYTPTPITFGGRTSAAIPAGEEILSDEIAFDVIAGETFDVSLYFADFTQMNAGTAITGPLSGGKYSYGNFAKSATLPDDLTRKTNWIYFLNTIDIFTEEKNFALVCFGDSITAQDWPDYLTLRCARDGFNNVAIIRRAVSGTRILREYSCITYAAYGLKGATRFPIEMNVAGARSVIVQHGINDIIHPVGVEVNKFRPWSDMPTADDLINGVRSRLAHLQREPRHYPRGVQRMAPHGSRFRRLCGFRQGCPWSRRSEGVCGGVRFGRPSAPEREGLRGHGRVRARRVAEVSPPCGRLPVHFLIASSCG